MEIKTEIYHYLIFELKLELELKLKLRYQEIIRYLISLLISIEKLHKLLDFYGISGLYTVLKCGSYYRIIQFMKKKHN